MIRPLIITIGAFLVLGMQAASAQVKIFKGVDSEFEDHCMVNGEQALDLALYRIAQGADEFSEVRAFDELAIGDRAMMVFIDSIPTNTVSGEHIGCAFVINMSVVRLQAKSEGDAEPVHTDLNSIMGSAGRDEFSFVSGAFEQTIRGFLGIDD